MHMNITRNLWARKKIKQARTCQNFTATVFSPAGLQFVPSEAFGVLAVHERLGQESGPAEGAASKEEVEKKVWSTR
jgi:hypothetical protein